VLGLNPNSKGLEFKRYIPEDKDRRSIETDLGVLMPSATFLKRFIGQPMRWKVRPTNLPSKSLDYYFMRSSFDTEDMKARQNLDCRLPTPSNVKMGAAAGVERLVREDGTAEPSFLYGHGERDGLTTAVKGQAVLPRHEVSDRGGTRHDLHGLGLRHEHVRRFATLTKQIFRHTTRARVTGRGAALVRSSTHSHTQLRTRSRASFLRLPRSVLRGLRGKRSRLCLRWPSIPHSRNTAR
jgi:hypothetical protein